MSRGTHLVSASFASVSGPQREGRTSVTSSLAVLLFAEKQERRAGDLWVITQRGPAWWRTSTPVALWKASSLRESRVGVSVSCCVRQEAPHVRKPSPERTRLIYAGHSRCVSTGCECRCLRPLRSNRTDQGEESTVSWEGKWAPLARFVRQVSRQRAFLFFWDRRLIHVDVSLLVSDTAGSELSWLQPGLRLEVACGWVATHSGMWIC